MNQKDICTLSKKKQKKTIQGGLLEIQSEIGAVHGNCRGSEAILRDIQLLDKSHLFLENNVGGQGPLFSSGKWQAFDKE